MGAFVESGGKDQPVDAVGEPEAAVAARDGG
jgi:hypothetical protein